MRGISKGLGREKATEKPEGALFFFPSPPPPFLGEEMSYTVQREDDGMGQEVDQSHSLTG